MAIACDVIHAVAQLLFPSFDTQGLKPRIKILESTDHCAFAVAIKLDLRVLLEVRDTRSRHDCGALNFWGAGTTSGCGSVDWHALPCTTGKSCGVCWARRMSCRGCPV